MKREKYLTTKIISFERWKEVQKCLLRHPSKSESPMTHLNEIKHYAGYIFLYQKNRSFPQTIDIYM